MTAGDKPLAKNARLSGGETITVTLPDPEPLEAVPQDIPLDVVYEDSDVIVVNKPKGLVVHPAPGHPDGTLVNALLHHCGDSLSGVGEAPCGPASSTASTGIPPASSSRRKTTSPIRSSPPSSRTTPSPGSTECIVVGNLREDAGTVDAPIGRHPTDRKKMAVVANGRHAVTHWDRAGAVSAASPTWSAGWRPAAPTRSGSTWPSIGHPILGDTVYGAKKAVPGLQGQCLHAVGLRFLHPRTGAAGGAPVPAAGGVSGPAPEAGGKGIKQAERKRPFRLFVACPLFSCVL